VMSTDHPNGGSFLAYPQIIRLLMDRSYRHEVLATVHPKIRERSILVDLDREWFGTNPESFVPACTSDVAERGFLKIHL